MRKITFQTGYFYHIYNRGVDKRQVFGDKYDYLRFLEYLKECNQEKPLLSLQIKRRENSRCLAPTAVGAKHLQPRLIDIVCYCLNLNHFHLLLMQVAKGGISEFMKRISGGYTNYFNLKNNRSGSLFQGTYKATEIRTDEYLLYLSCYINGNAEIHGIAKAENWPWSSYPDYIKAKSLIVTNKEIILKDFDNVNEYKDLTDTIIKESGERKDEIKRLLLE